MIHSATAHVTAAYLFAILIFVVDILLPNGYGTFYAYLVPVALLAHSTSFNRLFPLLLLCTAFLFAGIWIGPPQTAATDAIISDRLIGLGVLWVVAFLVNSRIRAVRDLQSVVLNKGVFENMSEGVIIASPSGRIVRVNPAARRILRLEPEPAPVLEWPGRNCRLQDRQSHDLPSSQFPLARVLRGERFEKADLKLSHSGTHTAWFVSFSGTPVHSATGKFTAAVLTLRDETERIRMEQDLLLARDNSEQQNRLLRRTTKDLEAANRELEGIAYSISHDLRTPLQTIIGFGDLALEDFGERLDETMRDYLRRMVRAGQHMDLLITDLLSLSRVSRSGFNPSRVNLSEMADAIVKEICFREPHRGREIDIVIQDGIFANVDPGLTRTALDNLLDNAFKFSSKAPKARIEFGARQQNGFRIFYVMDNGVGFNMDSADILFRPFGRLHPQNEFTGTGMGLAIVKRIVERHGGRIWAKAEQGKGATFFFILEPEGVSKQQEEERTALHDAGR